MSPTVDWLAAVLFYAVYLCGLLVFTVTNQATLANWPWAVTAADLAWGSVVSGATAWAATWVALRRAGNPGDRLRAADRPRK